MRFSMLLLIEVGDQDKFGVVRRDSWFFYLRGLFGGLSNGSCFGD